MCQGNGMNEKFVHVVVMGVTGTGKTTIAQEVAALFDLPFAEGDKFHSKSNRDKMAAGHPLTDEDRWPWLRSLRDWMSEQAAEGKSSVMACSALRKAYRDTLSEAEGDVVFVHLVLEEDLNAERLSQRHGHYMRSGMLESQLATLEPLQEDEDGFQVCNDDDPQQVVAEIGDLLEPRFGKRLSR